MPTHRALAGEQLAELLACLPKKPRLIRYWTRSKADLAAIERRRRTYNQIYLAQTLT